jgi:iron(III) transport system permease protein
MVSIAIDLGRATSKRLSRAHVYISVFPLILLTFCVVLLTVSPLIAVIVAAFRDAPPGQPGNWTLQGFATILSEPQYLSVIWTSIWLALLRAVLATVIAVVVAWILARTDCPFRDHLEFLVFLSFFFPVLGKVLGWALLASPNTGYINQLLRLLPIWSGDTGPLNIYSYEGVIFVSVMGWSITLIMFLLPAFRAMDASLEESAFVSGASAWRTFLTVTAPLMKPAIVAVFILALVRLFSSFETELFLGSRAGIYVFTNKIFDLMNILPPDYPTAFALALLLLLVTFALVVFNWVIIGGRSYTTVTGRSYSARPMRLGKLKWVAFSFVAIYLLFALILPVLVLIHTSFIKTAGLNVLSPDSYTLRNWNTLLSLEIPRRALINSLIMSIVATTIGMIVYSLVAYVVTRTDYKGRKILDLAAWLPWGCPITGTRYGCALGGNAITTSDIVW